MTDHLTVSEQESARRQAIRALRKRLDLSRPDARDFHDDTAPRAARLVSDVLHWSRFSVVLIALAAGGASAVRNVLATYTNYVQAGTNPAVATAAALAFVVSVEAALFVVALARAGIAMRRRAERAPRHVASLRTFWRGLLVRLGYAEPLRYDELPHRDGLGVVLALAFGFAVVANLAVALSPVLAATPEPLQTFIAGLSQKPAHQQVALALDIALALLPPSLALVGGELVARFAGEYAESGNAARMQYEAAVSEWRAMWSDPLATEDGAAYLESLLGEKAGAKAARKGQRTPAGGDGYSRERVPFVRR